jgi:ribosomal protein L11 methyltransferase
MNTWAIHLQPVDSDQAEWLPTWFDEDRVQGWFEDTPRLTAYVFATDWPEIEANWQEKITELGLTYTVEPIADRNWNAEWESSYEPVIIEDWVAIRAPFHKPIAGVVHELVIEPTRAFGTGHHETTWLMMAKMRELDLAHTRILDFGCGTGVLAILAGRMGATRLVGIDNEAPAVEIAIKNGVLNDTPHFEVFEGSLEQSPDEVYDYILANIHRSVLTKYMTELGKLLAPGGKLLISGILVGDDPYLEPSVAEAGLQATEKQSRGKWQMWQIEHK